MNGPGIRKVEIFGQDDQYLCVHGQGEGNRGCVLAEDQVHGLYDTPEKQTWKQGARTVGAKAKHRKILPRDWELGFHVYDTTGHTYEENESYLIQAVGFELDEWDDDAKYARIAVTTDISGVRYADIVQYEEPELTPKHDAIQQQYANPILKLRSGQPDWYEDDIITSFTWTDDGWGDIEIENPTNREMHQAWVFTAAPAGESEGVIYTVPDFSWRGKKGARHPGGDDESRYVTTPEITSAQGGLRIDRDPDQLMARDFHNTNILALFGGQSFMYSIPPYTQRQKLPVYAANVPDTGAMCQLIQRRRWSRPWGLELSK